jgi:hypothetical protein
MRYCRMDIPDYVLLQMYDGAFQFTAVQLPSLPQPTSWQHCLVPPPSDPDVVKLDAISESVLIRYLGQLRPALRFFWTE